jgi:hypothetical protein
MGKCPLDTPSNGGLCQRSGAASFPEVTSDGITRIMKKCPFCAEEIQDEAIKCKHCGEFLDPEQRPVPPALPGSAQSTLPFYFRTTFIVLMILSVPPLALPSVWLHPKLNTAWKIGATLVILVVSWATYVSIVKAFQALDQMSKMMDGMMKG